MSHKHPPVPPPASPDAIAQGCSCPRSTNDDGRGVVNPEDGRRYWAVNGDCPLHGYGALGAGLRLD